MQGLVQGCKAWMIESKGLESKLKPHSLGAALGAELCNPLHKFRETGSCP